jgi:hypothetical protein
MYYAEADKDDCAPYTEPNPDLIEPTLEVVSPGYYTGNEYLYVKANVEGELVVTQDGTQIPSSVIFKEWVVEESNGVGKPHKMFIIPTLPHKTGSNVFSLLFYPDKNLPKELTAGYGKTYIKSTVPVRQTFIVTKKFYNDGTGDIYVSPDGRASNNGGRGSPLDLQTAIDCAQPGQTIIMLNGTYMMSKFITIPRYNDGRMGAEKLLMAEERNKVTIDFNKNPLLMESNQGLMVGGAYWILDGFHICNTPDKTKGVVVSGYNNILRYITIYNMGDTGLQLSGNASDAKRYWPSGNSIEYCESFNNMDKAETDADGFAAKLTVGDDNQFLWCISHSNNDDGWDLFTKKETGPTGAVKLFGCVSHNNRRLLRGTLSKLGAGNGYKLGGEGIPIVHESHHTISFANVGAVYTSNSNPAPNHYNCTAIESDGSSIGNIGISSGDGTPAYGLRVDCLQGGSASLGGASTNWQSIMYTWEELYGGTPPFEFPGESPSPKRFMKRKPDGRPDLGDIYKVSEGSPGAWAFYTANKPNPPASFINTNARGRNR